MYLDFLAGLIILTFAFQLLLAVLALGPALLSSWLSRRDSESTRRSSALASQVVLSVVFAGFLGIVCTIYASQEGVLHRWVYAVTGFFATFVLLGRSAQEKQMRAGQAQFGDMPTDEGTAMGATIGVLAGLVAYPIAYNWPQSVTFIPGAPIFFAWSLQLAGWLSSFWFVKALALLSAAGYLLNAGFVALVAGIMVLVALWRGFASLVSTKRV